MIISLDSLSGKLFITVSLVFFFFFSLRFYFVLLFGTILLYPHFA